MQCDEKFERSREVGGLSSGQQDLAAILGSRYSSNMVAEPGNIPGLPGGSDVAGATGTVAPVMGGILVWGPAHQCLGHRISPVLGEGGRWGGIGWTQPIRVRKARVGQGAR